MKFEIVMGSEVSGIPAQKLRIIDSKVYSHSQMISTSKIHKLHQTNPNIYVFALDSRTKAPVGYISCIPLRKGTLSKTYISGFNEEEFKTEEIILPEFERSFDLFFSSIVIDPQLPKEDKALVALGLSRKYISYITNIMSQGNIPKEAAAHAVSAEGGRLCQAMGMIRQATLGGKAHLYHTDNIARSFFYKKMSQKDQDRIKDLIVNRMFDGKFTGTA